MTRADGIGVAIAPGMMTARSLARSGGVTWEHPLPRLPSADWDNAVREAMRALRLAAPRAGRVHLSLLPPFADVRMVTLPPAPVDLLRTTLAREPSKYFAVGSGAHVVQAAAGRGASGTTPHFVSAAPEHVITTLIAAAESAGFGVGSIAPAQVAWAAAATSGAGKPGGAMVAMVQLDGRADILELDEGRIVGVRRFPARPSAPFERSGAPGVALTVVARAGGEAVDIAARNAIAPDEFSLWPDRVYLERARATRRSAARWATAAAVCVAVAAMIAWFGAGRELARLSAQRASIRPQVAVALATRDSLAALTARAADLRAFDTAAPRWSGVLADLARLLPDEASFATVRASGDSLVMTGEAEHASAAFSALSRAPAIEGIRAQAPIQQHVVDGEVVAERFTIGARVRKTP